MRREILQELGESLVQTDCESFCLGTLRHVGWSPGQSVVLEGVRHTIVASTLRRIITPLAFHLIFLDTTPEILEKRRQHLDLPPNTSWDAIESHSTESQVTSSIKTSADLVLDASLPITQLSDLVLEFLSQD